MRGYAHRQLQKMILELIGGGFQKADKRGEQGRPPEEG
jgi:hypothetical protein